MTVFSQNSRFLKNGKKYIDRQTFQKIWYKRPTITKHFTDTTTIVKPQEEWRPALIAKRVYNQPELYWIIMLANNFLHVREFISGRTIILPSLARLQGNII